MGRKQKNAKPPDFLTAKRTYDHNHHIKLFDEMIDSPAWIVLSDGAKNVYLVIVKEYKGMYTGNKVKCPYSTMKNHGIRTQSIAGWLAELEALGFLKISTRGGLYKIPNEYTLVSEWSQIQSVEEARSKKRSALDKRKAAREIKEE